MTKKILIISYLLFFGYNVNSQAIIDKSKSNICKNDSSQTNNFIISPDFRLAIVPFNKSNGFGLTICKAFLNNKSCDYLGFGFEKFFIDGCLTPGEKNDQELSLKPKYVSIFLTNKYLFSKYSRHLKPFFLFDIGYSMTINKKELVNNWYKIHTNPYFQLDITDFKNGFYIKYGQLLKNWVKPLLINI